MSSSRSNTSGPGMTETRKPIAMADHDPLVLGAVDTSPPSNSQAALSPGAPPLPPRRTSPSSDSGHTPTTSPAPPVAKQVASDIVIPIPASGTTDESDNQTTNITPSRPTKPGPPALPPRPQSIKRLRSDLTVPLIPYNPWSAFKDDFMDSAALAARDRVLIEERERKNRQEEYELERQRIVPGLDNSDLIALVRSFDKVRQEWIQCDPYSKLTNSKCTMSTYVPSRTMALFPTGSISSRIRTRSLRWIRCGVVWRGCTHRSLWDC